MIDRESPGDATDRLVDELLDRVTNWGRWGPEDELGTLNLVTPGRRASAAACVRSGEIVSLALPLNSEWPQGEGSGRRPG